MREIVEIFNQMSPYLLLGFLFAGVMYAFIPHRLYSKYLGGSSFRSILYAALFGIPLPLCSCGVIPTAMSLRKEGASKGATVSFLIATPQTGVDSIIATFSLMGLPFALMRPLAALVTALFGGQMVNMFDNDQVSLAAKTDSKSDEQPKSFAQRCVVALRYAYVDMIQDIGRWLIIGLVVAGLITAFVPESFFALFSDNSLLSMLIVLLFAIPMYLCATGSIPIAIALMLKGLSPGTALVLLMAGPAVNAASMLVVGKVLGRRTLAIYILSIVIGAVTFGLGIDHLLPREWFTATLSKMEACCSEPTSWFNITCSVVLIALLINAMILRFRHKSCCDEEVCATKSQTYRIEGMRCNHCKANVEKALHNLEGVERVEIDLASGTATIEGTATDEMIRKTITSLGYKVL